MVGLSPFHPREDAQFSYRHASYQQLRRILSKATEELTVLDTLLD